MSSKFRQTLVTWVVVYPVVTGLAVLLDPLVGSWPTPHRTLVLSGTLVPIMVCWAMPVANRRFHGFLNPPGSTFSPQASVTSEERGT